MGLTVADCYYLKAKAAANDYCGDWNEVCEALNYALSYDDAHCASLCLLGEIYAKHLAMPENAFACFDRVIAIDAHYVEVYPVYIKYLIWNANTVKAKTVLDFAKTLAASDMAQLYGLQAHIAEVKGKYKTSLKHLKTAKRHCYNDYFFDVIEGEQERIQKKLKLDKKRSKQKISKKKKKSKKTRKK